MPGTKVKVLFEEWTFNNNIQFLEEGSKEELAKIARKKGVKLPSRDLAPFKCAYALVDEANQNGCTLPRGEVEDALPTLIGKAVDTDHIRGDIGGYWIDYELQGDTIISYGIFFKSNLPQKYDKFKKKLEGGDLKVSFEAWGERVDNEKGGYDLTNIEFAGGALLDVADPAFGDKTEVLEFARIYDKDDNIYEKGQEKYTCECLDCGNTIETEEHCRDIECPECGGEMRRIDRPGPGQPSKAGGLNMKKNLNNALLIRHVSKLSPELNELIPEKAKKWSTEYINDLPNSAFAVIEPAYKNGDLDNKNARHLPHHDGSGDLGNQQSNRNLDLSHYRNALARADQIKPISDSISASELRDKAQSHLEGHRDALDSSSKKDKNKGGKQTMDLEEKVGKLEGKVETKDEKIQELEDELAAKEETISELKEESSEVEEKIEEIEEKAEKKVEKAKKKAKKAAERRAELDVSEKEASDEDLLNDLKYKNLKLEKELSNLKEEAESDNDDDEDIEDSSIEIGTKENKDRDDNIFAIGKNVKEKAYPTKEE